MTDYANHPKQTLLFYIDNAFEDDDAIALEDLCAEWGHTRDWSIAAPEFRSAVKIECSRPDDLPAETVAIALTIYSAYPPWGEQLSYEDDKSNFDEAEFLVGALTEFSRNRGLTLGIELDGDQIGFIEAGRPDDGVSESLLGEWRTGLEQKRLS